ncbi:gastrula zinc finger protein XlCGF49.1-like [Centruroides sculpturatus]|uniref:gastrula zinc finger protein XlCGF49.1-like n=1 Tax=Centruroides sculpturatus TaxID=218467 RepID=UPI000C6EFD61|nr:gastrula zinc finger protein XlCGF49.1-like [Centruroides sculpturatus]XP_023233291.1 gastrula zinc finger protein XlCGF49.1-like [Centruroides sculpturatus]XP_023233292.1 gastrula zinc finger protein XlCGF49.1-like [Centruroides sculpturatus]XP_023233293.1 gastrula zinc finger protein XlCGF49.1-like [Centruroides sculpturatus]XP_023233294.1 gastrula zinc finger protein XlCGF49.1-like [Centruroides sculpturatus]
MLLNSEMVRLCYQISSQKIPRKKKLGINILEMSTSYKNISGVKFKRKKGIYHCRSCSKEFTAKRNLIIHRRIHTGEKPFVCHICDRRFNQMGNLQTHIRVHSGEKPFSCDQCQRSFTQKGNLITHLRIHTGEKPFNCELCFRRFSDKSALRSHVKIHTKERENLIFL